MATDLRNDAFVLRKKLYRRAVVDAFVKLDPRRQVRNPVMFITEVGALVVSLLAFQAAAGQAGFTLAIAGWLWLTVLFANFSEALAEGRGKAQAEALRRTRRETQAKKVVGSGSGTDRRIEATPSGALRQGDLYLVQAGDVLPADGEIIEGIASVDESAVTGESAPVVREAGGDRSAVTGGTRLLSDWLVVRVTAEPGHGFLERMIAMVEGAKRQRTPNEIALSILLSSFTIVFLVVCATLLPFSIYSVKAAGRGAPLSITVLVALLVCLIPTTIGGLLSAIGIAGMDRMIRRNVVATSGRAVEAAGDVDVLLLDKTGTITLGNRQAVEFIPVGETTIRELAEAAQLASLADDTPEGRSIVVLAKEKYGLRGRTLGVSEPHADEAHAHEAHAHEMKFIPFTAQTRMSGVDIPANGRSATSIRKGAPDTIIDLVEAAGNPAPAELRGAVEAIARSGGTPLVVSQDARVLGVVHLKDIVKGGIKDRFWTTAPDGDQNGDDHR